MNRYDILRERYKLKGRTMDLAKDVNNETVINDMMELIEHHGYQKCHLLHDIMNYKLHKEWVETNERWKLDNRQLAIELLDLMKIGLVSQPEIETELVKCFDEFLNKIKKYYEEHE